MSRLTRLIGAVAVITILHHGAAAQQARPPQDETNSPTVQEQDMLLGAWELDLDRSTFSPGPPPKGEVRSYQEEHEGIKADIVTTNADGTKVRMEYLSSFNVPV